MIKSRRMILAGHVARMGRSACRILVKKPEGKEPLGRPRRRCLDLRNIGWDSMDWSDLAQNRGQWRALVNTVMNLLVPQNVAKFFSNCTIGDLSSRAQIHEVSSPL
jgi:hypothetical protein